MSQRAFRCHVCGNGFFRAVVVPRPDGSLYATSFYECSGCSVVFVDPNAFNANEPGPPQSRGAKLPVGVPDATRNVNQSLAAATEIPRPSLDESLSSRCIPDPSDGTIKSSD